MNSMVVCIHRFEILDAQLVPLIGSLRKTIDFCCSYLCFRESHNLSGSISNMYSDFKSGGIWFLIIYKAPYFTVSGIGGSFVSGGVKHWYSPRVDRLTLMSVAH